MITSEFPSAIVGISIFDEQRQRFLYEQNEYVRLVPASNTKLLTTYAVLKYLPDSLPGWYTYETTDTLYIKPNADGTFLNRDFKEQRLYRKLQRIPKAIVLQIPPVAEFGRLGNSWPWNSYQASYVRERSIMPMYGNAVRFYNDDDSLHTEPPYFERFLPENLHTGNGKGYQISRNFNNNYFMVTSARTLTSQRPFTNWDDEYLPYHLLQDTLATKVIALQTDSLTYPYQPFYTQRTDSVLAPMLHNSDNFLAEQLLLMVSTKILDNKMSDYLAIKKIIQENFLQFDDTPIWVDGSGLSNGNRMSTRFFISLLRQMKKEFSEERLKRLLPHGNEGTLEGRYIGNEKYIYAKTGTLNAAIALSGYIETKKGNKLIFSFLVNNQRESDTNTRKSIEKAINYIIDHY